MRPLLKQKTENGKRKTEKLEGLPVLKADRSKKHRFSGWLRALDFSEGVFCLRKINRQYHPCLPEHRQVSRKVLSIEGKGLKRCQKHRS